MHVDVLSMDPRIARIHYLDYRKKVRDSREERRAKLEAEAKAAGKELGRIRIEKTRLEKEDEELMRAYREMALGQRILNLPSVLKKAGVDKQHHPKIAIARANWKDCWFNVGSSDVSFSEDRWTYHRNKKEVEKFGRGLFPAQTTNTAWRSSNGLPSYPLKAMVPAIPAHLRPKGDLSEFHILWEPRWDYVPPEDPILLRKITDSMYTVIAQWDLTPIEQAILDGRIT